jgi:hypothetical protein
MRRSSLLLLVVVASGACGTRATPVATTSAPVMPAGQLRAPELFSSISDRGERSRALFGEAARVLTHPRCVNCHPSDDTPRQGDRHEIHEPPIARGSADRGVAAMACTTCHQDRNLELARVPGAPNWHLAPRQMAWLDHTPAEICAAIKDPARNGGRSLAQIQDHVAHDPLVGWAWAPGADRAPAPGSQAALGALVQAWIDSGAECPR